MNPRKSHRNSQGFTLIEVMIAVVIVAILAAIALPTYNDQVRRSRRADAQAQLNDMAQCMERFNTSNGTYTNGDARCQLADTDNYGYAIAITNANSYTVTAAPSGAQTSDSCGTLGINQAGQRTHTSGTDCWK